MQKLYKAGLQVCRYLVILINLLITKKQAISNKYLPSLLTLLYALNLKN